MEHNTLNFIPPIPLLVRMGLNVITAADGLMPGERYIAYHNGPEMDATQCVCLWNDGTVQIMLKSSGWGYRTKIGPFDSEGDFLRALTN